MHRPAVLLTTLILLSTVAAATPLDDYLAAPDPSFTYGPTPVRTISGSGYTGYIWWMRSQQWRDSSEVDRPLWEHWVRVIKPNAVSHDTALLYISGGDNGGSAPSSFDSALLTVAMTTSSFVIELNMIPNQPLHFPDEWDPRYIYSGREEDEMIAYAWDKFYRTGDPTWLPRLPMTKAVLRAMDMLQAEYPQIQKFVVAGGSKRGWTTWTTAASMDPRVVAIAPCVIDVLNMANSMRHHHDAYGYWADAVGDYEDMGCMNWINSSQCRDLMAVVDPYAYVKRMTLPKMVINSTGDQFFLPDSWQFYWDALEGEKHLRYVPNTHHGLDTQAWLDIMAFYESILNEVARPQYSWERLSDGSLRVTTVTQPNAVRLWQAHNPVARNFRLDSIGAAWTSSPLFGQGNVYTASVPAPEQGWTAFMIELEFPSGGMTPFRFTTGVSVVPDTLPHRNVRGWGRLKTAPNGDHPIKVVEVGGDRYQMGYWYGKLLAADISQCLGGMMKTFMVPENYFDMAIGLMWNSAYFDAASWELELRGVADGCADTGFPDVTYRLLQKAMVLPDLAELGCSLMAAWGSATEGGKTYQFRNLDWNMDTGMQDFPVVAIYNPTDGIRHATASSAGVVGAICGGMNANGIAFSEIMGHFCDAEGLDGVPMLVLLRDILYHDATLAEALARVQGAQRTNQYHYAFADPGAPEPKGRLLFTSATRCDIYADESVVGHPCVSPDPFHASLPGVVYWKNHNGSGNQLLYNAINARYGTIDGDDVVEIARAAGVSGTVFSAVYENSDGKFRAAWADGYEPAHLQNYHKFSLAVGGSGYRTSIYADSREIPVVIVSGTPYEMGYQYGTLMKDEVQTLLAGFLAYVRQDPQFSNANLDAAWGAMEPYTDPRFIEEMQGLAAATDTDFLEVRRVHCVPALDSYACSSVAAWGQATVDGHLYQTRNLDWDLNAMAHNLPAIVVYLPKEGHPHMNVTFSGLIGSHTGMNSAGITLAQMGDSPGSEKPYDLEGTHFMPMLRNILYDADNLTEALDIITNAKRIKRYHYVYGDGKAERRAVKIKAHSPLTPPNDLVIWTDNDATDEYAPYVVEDIVYNDEERGAFPLIMNDYGSLDAQKMIAIANSIPIHGSNVVNCVYDATTLEFWISYALSSSEAYQQPYAYGSMTAFDGDGDGIPDVIESGVDTDSDGTPNYLDLDSDADGIADATEGGQDTDRDGKPNFMDTDSDSDGISDTEEGDADIDGDGLPNFIDTDSDDDGVSDALERMAGTDPYDAGDTPILPLGHVAALGAAALVVLITLRRRM